MKLTHCVSSRYSVIIFILIVDAVYIGTRNPSHVPITKHMLNAGKHLLCEVPMCLDTKQMHEVFNLAREKNKFLMDVGESKMFISYL